MKLDITKTNIKYNNYSGLPFEIQFLKDIKEGHSCLRLLSPLRIEQGEKRKRCNPKSDNRILTSDAFLNQRPNKQASYNRRLLTAAVFHFVHPVEKTVNKQIAWCCINFPRELTCQFLTNQSIKIGRRARPTRDHSKKRSSPPVFLKNWLNFRVRGQFEIKILIVRGHSDINTTYFIWIIGKNELEPTIIWNW